MVARAASEKPVEDRVKPVPHPATGTETVVVGCKVPNGIILREFRMVETAIRLPMGVVTDKIGQETGKRFTVRGPALAFGQIPNVPIVGGYALTAGVPRDLARTWFEQNQDSEIVKNNLMFFEDTMERATARAKEGAAIKSGLEPLDPNNLPPEFTKGKIKIKTAVLDDSDMSIAGT